ncbi:hypothetical protein TVAG_224580 [Trichomonas vaginalis G3]|uniref:Uncharacterized protein n=1 Tax=Trichomonas vaginalis (strain ATCC PRA-98 / G3) TaxID=412133 RepID=A2DW81_TRIV3|nr:hypothetical protein TVAGG3_0804310 [Trichomonas vaginalis G3]EAY15382.1 hypothetical protein TVAG_224580 [Trichomonas vaginalis G3]KAI5496743.1 hypothetical protein TVAGG3_0804310 [Trichomonas vaginalis G3]|eukprot:XP_001327605.1 hypothetical protein [Trichomonas vaginalis G3]
MSNASKDVKILRIVISSNISGTVLAEKSIDWKYVTEHVTIAKLCQVLLQLATEFDDGTVQFACFEPTDYDSAALASKNSLSNSETKYLNVGLLLQDDIITAVFYKIQAEKRIPEHADYVTQISKRIHSAFAAKHVELHRSLRSTLEKIVQEKATMPPDAATQFASFSEEIPALLH